MNLSKIILIAGLFIAQAGSSVKFHVMFIPHKIHELPRLDALDLTHAIEIECDDRTTVAQLNELLSGREKEDAPEWLRNAPEWVKEPKTVSSSPTGRDLLETPQRLVKDLFEANNVEASRVLFVIPRDFLKVSIRDVRYETKVIIVKNHATFYDLAQAIKDIFYPFSDAPPLTIFAKDHRFTEGVAYPSMELNEILTKLPGNEPFLWLTLPSASSPIDS